ncbi:hypothetical protein M409DRAFT_58801 [Zasmidium cellare ATCC 36951]|uniref:DUF8212 domain-containing protein n=1 Tax=Zasmidium cellare ATCC 36951 TaxID=1080233 RepID=A0A6A6C688_ZASCE|nr:uncharacterized protein M409DRAFT_58801 [Zasmidium cellare ATCC 36951]KAF2161720.1 hypothetical protein M409DRAFT_58801 [Zasmidium cellare ATCC 36951]
MDAFSRSRYWTRGWTLQELIAPPEVEFFDRRWKFVNSRTSAAAHVARITGIDASLLASPGRGDLAQALASYSVAERLSWAAGRVTTRVEDSAYSLFGLFGVNMPLLYGEGSAAFERLQQEILRATADLSILAWSSDPEHGLTPLARSARNFSNSRVVVRADALPFAAGSEDSDTAMSTGGLRCRYQSDITAILALKLTASSPSTQIDLQALMKQDRIECSVGWSSEPGQQRLVPVDVLDAADTSHIKTLFIRRNRVESTDHPSAFLSRPRGWTTLWLRIDKSLSTHDWEVLNMYPRAFWNRANYTFDLARAREERMRSDETAAAGDPLSTFGLPISAAIAISNKHRDRVAVFFTQHSPSLDDGIEFEVGPYENEESFLGHDFGRTKTTESRQKLSLSTIDITSSNLPATLSFDLRAVQISGLNVAVLAVSIAPPPSSSAQDKKTHHGLHGMSRVRGPLHLLKKHREELSSSSI